MALLREPLLGFLAAALLIFWRYESVKAPSVDVIHVDQSLVDALHAEFLLLNERTADEAELDALVERYIDEEVMVREAYARGLDKGDGRIRQRMIGKIDFLVEEEPQEPTPKDLEALYDSAPANYQYPATVDVMQVLAAPGVLAEAQRKALQSGEIEPAALGRVNQYYQVLEIELPQIIGPEATEDIKKAALNTWLGPFSTAGGDLLIQLLDRHEVASFDKDDLQRYLREDWFIEQRKALRRGRLDQLRESDRIKVDYATVPQGAVVTPP